MFSSAAGEVGVPVTIVHLDQSPGALNTHTIPDGATDVVYCLTRCTRIHRARKPKRNVSMYPLSGTQPIHLLYRPGHYDLLYPG